MFFTPFYTSLYYYSLPKLEKQYSCSPQTCSFSLALVLCCVFFLSLRALCPQTLKSRAYVLIFYLLLLLFWIPFSHFLSYYAAPRLACLLTHSAHSHHLLLSPPYLRVPVFSLQHLSLLSLPQCLAISAYLISRYLDKYRHTYTCPSPFLPLRCHPYFFFSPKGFSFPCSFFFCFKWWRAVGDFVHVSWHSVAAFSAWFRHTCGSALVWVGHGEAEDWEICEVFGFDYIKRVSNAVHWPRLGRALYHERWASWWYFLLLLRVLRRGCHDLHSKTHCSVGCCI